MWSLRSFFGDATALELDVLSEAKCRRYYAAMRERYAVDSHRNALAETKTFLRWCVRQRWIPTNYAEEIEGVGRRAKGKAQLTIDEARRWRKKALELARTETGAVAALCSLLLGLRASEIVGLCVRDVDDEGRILWVRESKTDAGRRRVEVPEELRGHLVRLAEWRAGDELILGRHWRDWPRLWVHEICDQAGVGPLRRPLGAVCSGSWTGEGRGRRRRREGGRFSASARWSGGIGPYT